MSRSFLTTLCLGLLAVAFTALPASAAEPIIVLSSPTAESIARSAGTGLPERSASPGGFGSGAATAVPISAPATNEPSDSIWLVPFIVDGGNPLGSTTLLSVTNELESSAPVAVDVEFYNAVGDLFHIVNLVLDSGQLQSFNVRDQPGLSAGVSMGFIQVVPEAGAQVTVDYYLVTPDQDFASGDVGFLLDELCTSWRARVLAGGPFTGGTEILFLVNGSRGSEVGDPATVTGVAYDEDGVPVSSFEIFTDLSVFVIDAADVLAGDLFGYIELTIDSEFGPPFGGYVFTTVGAEGRYSVGTAGFCRDSL